MWKTDYKGIHEKRYQRLKKKRITSQETDNKSYKKMLEIIDDAIQRRGMQYSGRLLEIGCGAGNLSLLLSRRGFNVHGIDISETAIKIAKEKASASNIKSKFKTGNAVKLPYKNKSFDIVVDAHCLHCIIGEDRKEFLSDTRRILKFDGLFVVMTMCGDPQDSQAIKYFDPQTRCTVKNGIAGRYFGLPEEIINEIKGEGFKILHHRIDKEDIQDELIVEAGP